MKIAVIGTLDTKEKEVRFLREQIVAPGYALVVVDPGILGKPALQADVTRWEIAHAGGEELETLVA